MKNTCIFILLCLSIRAYSQVEQAPIITEKYKSASIGFLQGGGSLIGADFEFLLTDRFGVQVGLGFIGFGGGLTYHLKPSIRSSFISVQYWNQGTGESFTQNIIGSTFVYRGKRWFTSQLGLGVPLQRGPALPSDFNQPQVMLMYSIGAYLPF